MRTVWISYNFFCYRPYSAHTDFIQRNCIYTVCALYESHTIFLLSPIQCAYSVYTISLYKICMRAVYAFFENPPTHSENDGRLNFVPDGWISFRLGYQQIREKRIYRWKKWNTWHHYFEQGLWQSLVSNFLFVFGKVSSVSRQSVICGDFDIYLLYVVYD